MKGYNFIIIGKSGVGKSSLLNYILGQDEAKTGSGKPVTGKTFDKFSTRYQGARVNVYDSWGLEPGKTNEWERLFDAFLEKKKNETNVSNWIHTVVFCVSGGSKRLEPFEERILNKLQAQKLAPVLVITKSDKDTDGTFYDALKRKLKMNPIKVCSVNENIGVGKNKTISERNGVDDLHKQIRKNTIKSYKERISVIRKSILETRKREGVDTITRDIDSFINGQSFLSSSEDDVKIKLESLLKTFDEETINKINKLVTDAKDYFEKNIDVSLIAFGNGITLEAIDSKSFIDELPWYMSIYTIIGAVCLYIGFAGFFIEWMPWYYNLLLILAGMVNIVGGTVYAIFSTLGKKIDFKERMINKCKKRISNHFKVYS